MSRKHIPPSGLEATTRELLTRLHRSFPGPFEVSEASGALGLRKERTRRLLAYLAERGWLSRIRRGLYTTVPIEATDPANWLADPWTVAEKTFSPCYVGGWTALHHWELTEQLFRPVVVFTATEVRRKETIVQGTVFRLRQVSSERLFGTTTVWRQKVPVKISDPERTLIDTLDRPEIGGGIRHVADCVQAWLDEPKRRIARIIDYGEKLGNHAVFKRLGYIIEARGLNEPELLDACTTRIRAGLSPLEPSSKTKGRVLKRWGLRVNARV